VPSQSKTQRLPKAHQLKAIRIRRADADQRDADAISIACARCVAPNSLSVPLVSCAAPVFRTAGQARATLTTQLGTQLIFIKATLAKFAWMMLHRVRQSKKYPLCFKLPVGHTRNDLRQLASGLLRLDKKNLQATVQDRVTAILALIDSRN
jgi:hypothetical protein